MVTEFRLLYKFPDFQDFSDPKHFMKCGCFRWYCVQKKLHNSLQFTCKS